MSKERFFTRGAASKKSAIHFYDFLKTTTMEFRKDPQFLIITHAKRTMSIADMLFGITMQQKGASKKISVKFDSYEPQQEEETIAVA
jgi:hypothetical protein